MLSNYVNELETLLFINALNVAQTLSISLWPLPVPIDVLIIQSKRHPMHHRTYTTNSSITKSDLQIYERTSKIFSCLTLKIIKGISV